jgi:hypothetical protein
VNWFKQLFSRKRQCHELSETIREHLDEKIADLIDGGMTREQAERVAHREFGNVALIKERSREVWQWATIESIIAGHTNPKSDLVGRSHAADSSCDHDARLDCKLGGRTAFCPPPV